MKRFAVDVCELFKFKQLNWPIHEHKRDSRMATAFVFINFALLSALVCRLPVGLLSCLLLLLLILYIQISSFCTSATRIKATTTTTVIFFKPADELPDWLNDWLTDWVDCLMECLPVSGLIQQCYQVACEVLILKSVTLECAAQVTDQVAWQGAGRSSRWFGCDKSAKLAFIYLLCRLPPSCWLANVVKCCLRPWLSS